MRQHKYVYIWSYVVKPGSDTAFRELYGPEGRWVALFRQAEGYLDTRLLCDRKKPNRYVTIDSWISQEAHARFRREDAERFAELDQEGKQLTLEETYLGEYRSV